MRASAVQQQCRITVRAHQRSQATPMMKASTTRVLDHTSAPSALDGISTLVLDCDGVLWRGNEVLPNTVEALDALRSQGKRLLFVTNNSSKSRATYVKKFQSLGIKAETDEIVSSSYAAAAYLHSIGFKTKVFLIGQQGVEDELKHYGIQYVGGSELELPLMEELDVMKKLQVDQDIGAVVVGWDPRFSYSKMVYASVCLREIPGCIFVATNTDSGDNLGNGRIMPGTGGLVSAVQIAAGCEPVVVGKGGPWLLPFLCRQYGLETREAAIVGDRLDTDIAIGKQGGLRTFLPLTGITTLQDLESADEDILPDHVITSFSTLAGLPS